MDFNDNTTTIILLIITTLIMILHKRLPQGCMRELLHWRGVCSHSVLSPSMKRAWPPSASCPARTEQDAASPPRGDQNEVPEARLSTEQECLGCMGTRRAMREPLQCARAGHKQKPRILLAPAHARVQGTAVRANRWQRHFLSPMKRAGGRGTQCGREPQLRGAG